jgi:spore germination protein YaaH
MFFAEELQGVQKSTIAALCNCLRQIATFFERHGNLQQVATFCDSQTAQTGTKHRIVEHKGIVERAGIFSLVTSARSVVSAVGQTAPVVRPMFDAGIPGQKNA